VIVELHPEELIDREARGALSDGERMVLDAHAARCAACDCERRLRTVFADALREPLSAELPERPAERSVGRPVDRPMGARKNGSILPTSDDETVPKPCALLARRRLLHS